MTTEGKNWYVTCLYKDTSIIWGPYSLDAALEYAATHTQRACQPYIQDFDEVPEIEFEPGDRVKWGSRFGFDAIVVLSFTDDDIKYCILKGGGGGPRIWICRAGRVRKNKRCQETIKINDVTLQCISDEHDVTKELHQLIYDSKSIHWQATEAK